MRAPKHLRAGTRRWFESVLADYELDGHHLKLLQLAGEAYDRGQSAREELLAAGSYYTDGRGNIRPHPAINVERDSRLSFARLVRELGLDVAPPAEAPRPHLLPGSRGTQKARS